jgi:hypothetical protein
MVAQVTDIRPLLNRQISEKAFQAQVLQLAQACGWKYYHPYDSRRSVAGYPDITLVRANRLLLVELKTERGRMSSAQQSWREALLATGKVEYYLWRPRDWNEIVDVLARDKERRGRAA